MGEKSQPSHTATSGYNWAGRKVLVTGASGFKGSWLCKALLDLGARVHGTKRRKTDQNSAYSLFDLGSQMVTYDVDIADRQQVFDMLNSVAPEVIFHLAAKAQVPVALRDPVRAYQVNAMGTVHILEGCRQLQIGERMLVISTDHVFGHVDEQDLLEGRYKGGFDVSSPVGYGGPYATSKSAMEQCVRSYQETYGSQMPALGITRSSNVFGYGDVAHRRVLPRFVSWTIEPPHEVPITCRKNGRQFIYINDVVCGYLCAAAGLGENGSHTSANSVRPDQGSSYTPTFHFAVQDYAGTDEPFIRIKALGQLVIDQLDGYHAELVETADCVDYKPHENPVQALKCERTCARLGWAPRTGLAAGIRKLGTWYEYGRRQDTRSRKRLLAEEIDDLLCSLH